MNFNKKRKLVGNIFGNIFVCFTIVFILYLISELIDNFAFNYFVFPFFMIMIIFVCGVNVGKLLERMRTGQKTNIKDNKNKQEAKTEFSVNDRLTIITNKKILKELEDGEIVHVKTFNYDEIDLDNEKKA